MVTNSEKNPENTLVLVVLPNPFVFNHLEKYFDLDRTCSTYFLRRDVKRDRPEVDLLVGVDTGHDKEETRTLGPT